MTKVFSNVAYITALMCSFRTLDANADSQTLLTCYAPTGAVAIKIHTLDSDDPHELQVEIFAHEPLYTSPGNQPSRGWMPLTGKLPVASEAYTTHDSGGLEVEFSWTYVHASFPSQFLSERIKGIISYTRPSGEPVLNGPWGPKTTSKVKGLLQVIHVAQANLNGDPEEKIMSSEEYDCEESEALDMRRHLLFQELI